MKEVKLHARIITKLTELNKMKNDAQTEINKMIVTILDQEDIDYNNKKISLSTTGDSIIIEENETKGE